MKAQELRISSTVFYTNSEKENSKPILAEVKAIYPQTVLIKFKNTEEVVNMEELSSVEITESIQDDIIYEVLFTDSIYESAYATMSLHRTIKGAYEGLKKVLMNQYNEWLKMDKQFRKRFKPNMHTAYCINKTVIQP